MHDQMYIIDSRLYMEPAGMLVFKYCAVILETCSRLIMHLYSGRFATPYANKQNTWQSYKSAYMIAGYLTTQETLLQQALQHQGM